MLVPMIFILLVLLSPSATVKGWCRAVVMRTYISRPRSSKSQPERRIVVCYESAPDELWEHGLRDTPVQLLSLPPSSSSPPVLTPSSPVPPSSPSSAPSRRRKRVDWALMHNPNSTRASRSSAP